MEKRMKMPAWLLVAMGCLLYAISGGIRVSFGVLVSALAASTGIGYAQVSFAAAVGQLLYGASQPFFGLLALRKSNGFVLTLGVVLMSTGLLLTAAAGSAMMLTLSIGLLFFSGTGAVCFGIIMGTLSPLLGKEKASAASGFLNASSGIGASLLSPLMQALQASIGVRALLMVLCIPVLALIPVCIYLWRLCPKTQDKGASVAPLAMLRTAVADPDYRRLMASFGTCGFHMCIIQTHIYSQIVSYGLPETTASLAYTVFGLMGMAGSVICGFLCQRLRHKNVLGSLYLIRAVAVALFLFLLPKEAIPVFLFITVLGLTGDATVTPTSELISRRYGPECLGFLFGITFVCHQIGGFISTWAGGLLIAGSGDYQTIWMIDIALCTMAAVCGYRIRQGKAEN